jgi:general secretion pathway protein M
MTLLTLLRQRWQAVPSREQRLLLAALFLVLAALLWWVGVAPALATLRSAQSQRLQLEAQLHQMQRLQVQAQALQAQPRLVIEEARRLLEASLKPLGAAAQLVPAGERMSVTFKAISADALAQWLIQARLNARAVPSEARLVRNAAGSWDGMVLLTLGSSPPR